MGKKQLSIANFYTYVEACVTVLIMFAVPKSRLHINGVSPPWLFSRET